MGLVLELCRQCDELCRGGEAAGQEEQKEVRFHFSFKNGFFTKKPM
jgi:hypothetical protein